jgi:hypothetical protein
MMNVKKLPFLDGPRATKAETAEWSPHLANWSYFAKYCKANTFNQNQVRKMLILELEGRNREIMVNKLHAKFCVLERTRQWSMLTKVVK